MRVRERALNAPPRKTTSATCVASLCQGELAPAARAALSSRQPGDSNICTAVCRSSLSRTHAQIRMKECSDAPMWEKKNMNG